MCSPAVSANVKFTMAFNSQALTLANDVLSLLSMSDEV